MQLPRRGITSSYNCFYDHPPYTASVWNRCCMKSIRYFENFTTSTTECKLKKFRLDRLMFWTRYYKNDPTNSKPLCCRMFYIFIIYTENWSLTWKPVGLCAPIFCIPISLRVSMKSYIFLNFLLKIVTW